MSPKSIDGADVPIPLQLNSNKDLSKKADNMNEESKLKAVATLPHNAYSQTSTPKKDEAQDLQTGPTPPAEVTSENKPAFEESPYRFVIVVVYFLLSFGNGMQWVTFASSANRFRLNYGLERIQVDLFSMIFMIEYPFLCVPEGYLIDNISVRIGLSLAALFTILGAGIKCLTNYHIAWAYVGQILAGLFQPAILNSPGKIASVWFKDSNRALVTSICVAANTIGVLFGYLYHTFFIDNEAFGQQYKDEFYDYVFWEFILVLFLCLPTFFLMYSKPKKPVSNSQLNYKSLPLLESLKLLFKNSSFNYLLGCSTCIIGFVNIYGTILNPYMATYGISDDDASYTAAAANGFGIVAALVVSTILDKWKKFRLTMLILNLAGIITLILITILLEVVAEEQLFIVIIILFSLLICCAVPIFSTGMDYVCELTYPVGESISGGLIMCCNQISGIVGILISNAFIEFVPDHRYLTNLLAIVLFVISIVCVWMIKEKLLRNEKEKENEIEKK